MPYWKLFYHFIWATKDRQPLLLPTFESELYRVIAAKVIELEGIVQAIGGTDDHIHIATSVSPKLAIARYIGEVKGSSSHFVNHVVRPGFEFAWQEEYGVLSLAEKGLPGVVRYIHNQRIHHREGTTLPVLEQI